MQRKTSLASVALAGALALGGCATSAGLADSAISTNLQIEDIQNRTTLLNVVRASLRRPPVYQQFAQFSGTTRPSTDVTLGFPFGLDAATVGNLGFALKANEGPRVQSTPLDSQEFYQGIMAPIKMGVIDFYVQQGYPKALLYNLLIGRIELTGDDAPVVIKNYVSDDNDVNAFQMLIDHLIVMGLTTEPVTGAATQYGGLRTAKQVSDLAGTAAAAAAGLSVSQTGKKYRVAKSTPASARFCFDPRGSEAARASNVVQTCPAKDGDETTLKLKLKDLRVLLAAIDTHCRSAGGTSCDQGQKIATALCTKPKPSKADDCGDKSINISFVIRSTDGVIYYLGEVARRRLYPDGGEEPRTIGYRREPNVKPSSPATPCTLKREEGGEFKWSDKYCHAIFWVDQDDVANDVVSVDYEGSTFSVPGSMPAKGEPHLGARSSQVLGIAAQLIALNRLAKDAPNTSIVNVLN